MGNVPWVRHGFIGDRKQDVLKRGQYLALGVAGGLLVVLLNLPPSAAARLKLAIGSIFLPLLGLSGAANSFVDDLSMRVLPRSSLIAQVRELERENQTLRLEASQGRIALEENIRLRQQMLARPEGPWKWQLARVVGRDPTTWWRTVQIDYGARRGAQLNQAVVTPQGLVGRISFVGEHFSRVALLGDADCQVTAIIQETRDFGVIKGPQATLQAGILEWTALRSSPDVMAGQTVMTSGEGGVFPKGLVVGQILDTRSVQAGLYTVARVRLAVDLGRLEEVWVLSP